MAISTYAELKTAAADWLNRDDLTAVIPTFVTLTESIVNATLRLRQQLVRVQASIDAEYEALPTGYLEMKTIHLVTNPLTVLSYVPPGAFNGLPTAGVSGRPTGYTVLGDKLRFASVPDGAYTAEMQFYKKIAALSESNAANWLLDDAPEVYLYGTLMQASPYLRDDERVLIWKAAFDEALARLKDADGRASYGASPLAIRQGVRW